MVAKWYGYEALTVGSTFTNGETTKPLAMGATQAVVSNGTLAVVSDAPTGLTNSLEGTSQSVSGTSYITESVTASSAIAFSVYWKMPTAVGTIGAGLFFCGNGATRTAAMSVLSTEQIRMFSASGGTLFTSTYTGGFLAGIWYRTDMVIDPGTTTSNGRIACQTCLAGSSTPLADTSYDPGATVNAGTLDINIVRHGTRTGTGTADENFRVRAGYELGRTTFLGDQPLPAEPSPTLRWNGSTYVNLDSYRWTGTVYVPLDANV